MKGKKDRQAPKPKTAPAPQNKNLIRGLYLVLGLVILIMYVKTVAYDFAIDDKIIIVDNAYVSKGLAGFPGLIGAAFSNNLMVPGVTRPVTMFTHALEVSLFGMNPGPQHLMNVLFYLFLVLLLFGLLRKHLLPSASVWLSFGVALLFAVHPVHVESVANIKGRDDILCFIFGALSTLYFFRYRKEGGKRLLWFSLLFLALSFFSKETGFVFALLIPLSYYYTSGEDLKKAFGSAVPLLAAGAVFLIIRLALFSNPPEHINIYNNSLLAIADPAQRWAMAFRILLQYLQIAFWPHPLSWDYSLGHFVAGSSTVPLAVASVVLYAGLTAFGLLTLKKKNLIGFGALFFLVALFPASNLVIRIATTFGDRLLFIPIFGFCLAIGVLLQWAFSRLKARGGAGAYVGLALLSGVFLVMSSIRVNAWKNDDTLVNTDYAYANSLRSMRAYIQNLTSIPGESRVANHQKALTLCNEALEKYPDDWQLWYFKGVIHGVLDNPQGAREAYKKSLEYNGKNFYSLVNYANLLADDDPAQAITLYQQALAIKPDQAIVLGNLGILLHKAGRLDEARQMYEKSLQFNPNDANIRNAYDILNGNQ